MKTLFQNIAILILSGFSIISCTPNDPTGGNPNPTNPCANIDILGVNIAESATTGTFDSSSNSLAVPNFAPIFSSSVATFQASSTNNAIYNPLTHEYKLVSAEHGKLITVNTVTNTGTETAIPLFAYTSSSHVVVNAPVYIGGNEYFGCYDYTNGIFSLVNNSFATVGATLSVPLSTLTGYEYSKFTSTTDGIDNIYFVLGNRIINYKISSPTTPTVSPVVSGISSGCLIGLTYKGGNKLFAIHQDWGVANSELVKLDVTNPVSVVMTSVYNFGFQVNPDFFSTLYDRCNKVFYVSTMPNVSTFPNGQITKISFAGLSPVSLGNTTTTNVELGLTLKM